MSFTALLCGDGGHHQEICQGCLVCFLTDRRPAETGWDWGKGIAMGTTLKIWIAFSTPISLVQVKWSAFAPPPPSLSLPICRKSPSRRLTALQSVCHSPLCCPYFNLYMWKWHWLLTQTLAIRAKRNIWRVSNGASRVF